MRKLFLMGVLFIITLFFYSCEENSTEPTVEGKTTYTVEYKKSYGITGKKADIDKFLNEIINQLPDESIVTDSQPTISGSLHQLVGSANSFLSFNMLDTLKQQDGGSEIVGGTIQVADSKKAEFESKINTNFTNLSTVITKFENEIFPKSLAAQNNIDIVTITFHAAVYSGSNLIKKADYNLSLPVVNGTKWKASTDAGKFVEFINDTVCTVNIDGNNRICFYSRHNSAIIKVSGAGLETSLLFNSFKESNKFQMKIDTAKVLFIRE